MTTCQAANLKLLKLNKYTYTVVHNYLVAITELEAAM